MKELLDLCEERCASTGTRDNLLFSDEIGLILYAEETEDWNYSMR